MPFITVNGCSVKVTEEGYLINLSDWNKAVVEHLAPSAGIANLTDDHWAVINYLHSFYKQNNDFPRIRQLCVDTGCSLRYIYELFPTGPVKGACRLAGIPKPAGCI